MARCCSTRCCAVSAPAAAVLVPLLLSLAFDGWIREYVPPARWSVDMMPRMDGKVCVVTGPTEGGIGFESALELARRGCRVIVGGRGKKVDRAAAAIKDRLMAADAEAVKAMEPVAPTGPRVEAWQLDLASLASVKAFGDKFEREGGPLHVLMLNAGVMACPFGLTEEGVERQFGTNHLGHFLLSRLLLPALERGAPSRVVAVSSAASLFPDMIATQNFTDVHAASEAGYGPWAAYGRSKLANVLFAQELSRRLGDKKVYVNSCHPGGIKTNLQVHAKRDAVQTLGETVSGTIDAFVESLMMQPPQGAVTQLYLATSAEIEERDLRGRFFWPQAREVAPASSATPEAGRELWDVSEALLARFGYQ